MKSIPPRGRSRGTLVTIALILTALGAARPASGQFIARADHTGLVHLYYQRGHLDTPGYADARVRVDYRFYACRGAGAPMIMVAWSFRPEYTSIDPTYYYEREQFIVLDEDRLPPTSTRLIGDIRSPRHGTIGRIDRVADPATIHADCVSGGVQYHPVAELADYVDPRDPAAVAEYLSLLRIDGTMIPGTLRDRALENRLNAEIARRAEGRAYAEPDESEDGSSDEDVLTPSQEAAGVSDVGSADATTSAQANDRQEQARREENALRSAARDCDTPSQYEACLGIGEAERLMADRQYVEAWEAYDLVARMRGSDVAAHAAYARSRRDSSLLERLMNSQMAERTLEEGLAALADGDYQRASDKCNFVLLNYDSHDAEAERCLEHIGASEMFDMLGQFSAMGGGMAYGPTFMFGSLFEGEDGTVGLGLAWNVGPLRHVYVQGQWVYGEAEGHGTKQILAIGSSLPYLWLGGFGLHAGYARWNTSVRPLNLLVTGLLYTYGADDSSALRLDVTFVNGEPMLGTSLLLNFDWD